MPVPQIIEFDHTPQFMKKSGIYLITSNIDKRKCYIGSATHFGKKLLAHNTALAKGKHSPKMQQHFDKYSLVMPPEHMFNFQILEVVEEWEFLVDVEQAWLDCSDSYFNCSPIAGLPVNYQP